jgi:EAL domain
VKTLKTVLLVEDGPGDVRLTQEPFRDADEMRLRVAVIDVEAISFLRREGVHAQVVAEGVETLEELEFLSAHQCDEAQGFYFSRPVPPANFAELLRTGISELKDIPSYSIVPESGGIGKLHDGRGIAGAPLEVRRVWRTQSE